MVELIEKLQRELTDKYVVVNEGIPELARFGGHVGQVKTINMNGRALVQFEAWNNIGWYDIEVDCLRVVPKPEPGAAIAEKKDAKKAAPKPVAKAAEAAPGGKKLSPLEMARMQGAAKPAGAAPAAGGAKKSTADILAAARGAKAAAPAAKPAAPAKPAAGGKMSTADILAAARAKKAAESEPAAEATAEVEEAVADPATTPEPAAAKPAKASGGTALPEGRRPTVAEILAWCREHDTK